MEVEPDILKEIEANSKKRENLLSEYATKNSEFKRRKGDKPEEPAIRPPFYRDADRILHSKSFSRYIDKTQVFFLVDNDHITHRVLHVQLVSKIARAIGKALRLNEDLLEAISLGHDIGHVPYGHQGETILSNICEKNKLAKFKHNVQSVQFLNKVENKDLTIQVLDGILCHNGEVLKNGLKPDRKLDWDSYDSKIESINRNEDPMPMTLEGCVVRVSDLIAYLGRDLEDAVEVKLIDKDLPDFPTDCKEFFGYTPRTSETPGSGINWLIIDTLIRDIINNSFEKDEVTFSSEALQYIKKCKEYNYKYIYNNYQLLKEKPKIECMYKLMFEHYLLDLSSENKESLIYTQMINLDWVSKDYLSNSSSAEKVRDFLAGMTDRYFENAFKQITNPKRVNDFGKQK
jgi:dGTPase